jgi:hypothetical protein
VRLRELHDRSAEDVLAAAGIPLDDALAHLPAVALDEAGALALGAGARPIVTAGAAPVGAGPRSVVFRDREGRALALGELAALPDGVRACPHVVFPWAVRTGRSAADGVGAPSGLREVR